MVKLLARHSISIFNQRLSFPADLNCCNRARMIGSWVFHAQEGLLDRVDSPMFGRQSADAS